VTRTKRKPYTGSKRFDRSCRNHGGCDYCKNNRTHQGIKAKAVAAEKVKDNT
jgi:hypothetical protein